MVQIAQIKLPYTPFFCKNPEKSHDHAETGDTSRTLIFLNISILKSLALVPAI